MCFGVFQQEAGGIMVRFGLNLFIFQQRWRLVAQLKKLVPALASPTPSDRLLPALHSGTFDTLQLADIQPASQPAAQSRLVAAERQLVTAAKVERWENPNEVFFFTNEACSDPVCSVSAATGLSVCTTSCFLSVAQQLQGCCLKHSNSAKTLLKYHWRASSQFQPGSPWKDHNSWISKCLT